MRQLHEICTADGCAMVWADGIENARTEAAKKIASANTVNNDSLMLGFAAFLVIMAFAMLAVYLVVKNADTIDGLRTVSCSAPQDEGQKLTVRLVRQDGGLQEQCEYASVGFGRAGKWIPTNNIEIETREQVRNKKLKLRREIAELRDKINAAFSAPRVPERVMAGSIQTASRWKDFMEKGPKLAYHIMNNPSPRLTLAGLEKIRSKLERVLPELI